MHRFPLKDKERLNKWTAFVRRHRPKFIPQQYSVLCSMHFADSAFTVNAEVAKSLNMRRHLCPDAVPTVDSVQNFSMQGDLSNRDRRMVCANYKHIFNTIFSYVGKQKCENV